MKNSFVQYDFSTMENLLSKDVESFISKDLIIINNLTDIVSQIKFDNKSTYRFNIARLCYLERGKAITYINKRKHIIKEHSLIYLSNENFSIEKADNLIIKYLIINKNLFEKLNNCDFPFSCLDNITILSYDEELFFKNIFQTLLMSTKEKYHNPSIIYHLLSSIFCFYEDIITKSLKNHKNSVNSSIKIYGNFMFLVNKYYLLHKNLEFYIKQLGISDSTLLNVTKEFSGKTPFAILSEKYISKAKEELVYSDKEIKSISLELKFNELSSFTRFFKKHTGISPQEYRKQYQIKTD